MPKANSSAGFLNAPEGGLSGEYKGLIDGLRAFLGKIEADMDSLERSGRTIEEIERWHGRALFDALSKAVSSLDEIASGFDDKEHLRHSLYLREKIHPIALKSPFNRRCFEKPLGYPGDFLTMEMIYSEPRQGDSVFAKLLNAHSLSLPMVEGVRGRCRRMKEIIDELIDLKPDASFLSLGAGPAMEVREVLGQREGCRARFSLLDQDSAALDFVKSRLSDRLDSIRLMKKEVRDLAKDDFSETFDLIYSTGLTDYLPTRFARRLMHRVYRNLRPGGRLVIANASANPHRVWMEHGTDWHLIYRDGEALLSLAEGLSPTPGKVYVRDETGFDKLFLLLVVEK